TSQEALFAMADKFKVMEDGPRKAALATKLLGDAGADLIPVLNQGSEALREQMKTAEEMGAIMSEELIQKSLEVDEAFNRFSLGGQGIANMLWDAFAPSVAL